MYFIGKWLNFQTTKNKADNFYRDMVLQVQTDVWGRKAAEKNL